MNRIFLFLILTMALAAIFTNCTHPEVLKPPGVQDYSLGVSGPLVTNAPALQSFVLGTVSDTEWILFGGRTSQDSGGLHKMMGCDYAYGAFPSRSFNSKIYFYQLDEADPEHSTLDSLDVSDLVNLFEEICSLAICDTLIGSIHNMFVHTNAMYYQEDTSLYVIGGYGPTANSGAHFVDASTGKSGWRYEYLTRQQFFRLNLPLMAKLIKNKKLDSLEEYLSLLKPALKVPQVLISTGGELFKQPGTDIFYLVGGHNYQEIDSVFATQPDPGSSIVNCDEIRTPFMQRYVNAVYEFELIDTLVMAYSLHVTDMISDKALDSLSTIAHFKFPGGYYDKSVQEYISGVDSTTLFRRRDAPMTPSLYLRNGGLEPAMAIYGGVFRYFGIAPTGQYTDSLRANVYYPLPWNDALFFMPNSEVPYQVDSYQESAPPELQNSICMIARGLCCTAKTTMRYILICWVELAVVVNCPGTARILQGFRTKLWDSPTAQFG